MSNDEDLMFSDEENQELFAEMLINHYVAQGMDEEEAVENVLASLRDPKWKIDVARRTRTRNELVPALQVFFESTAPERLGEVYELCDSYADQEGSLGTQLQQEYAEAPGLADLIGTIRVIEERYAVVEQKKLEGTQLENFLRKFFARFEPWDGADREERATELYQQYFFRSTWAALHDMLRQHYPKALELTELANYLKEGESQDLVDEMCGTTSSTPDLNGTHGAFTSEARDMTEVPQQEAPTPAPPPEQLAPPDSPDNASSPPQHPVLPKMPRKFWLESNAKIAQFFLKYKKGNWLTSLARNTAVSIGFRIYFGTLLVYSFLLAFLYGIHIVYILEWRLFLGKNSGYAPALGTLCLLISAVVLLASLLTSMKKTIHQWCFMDDAVLLGDIDYAELWRDRGIDPRRDAPMILIDQGRDLTFEPANPIPAHLRHVLPPYLCLTVFGLPTSKAFIREWYLGFIVTLSTVVPFLYAVIRAPAGGDAIYAAVGFFFEFILLFACGVHFALWCYAWSLGVRSKFRSYYLWKSSDTDTPFESDRVLMSEFALDQTTVGNNCIYLLITLGPLSVLFWVSSRAEISVTMGWVVSILVMVMIFLLLREVLRLQKYRRVTAYGVVSLIIAYAVLGVVGTASIHYTAVLMFVFCLMANQMLLVPHRVRPTPLVSLAELRRSIEAGLDVTSSDPKSEKEAPAAEESEVVTGKDGEPLLPRDRVELLMEQAVKEIADEGVEKNTAIPGKRVLFALCSCTCFLAPFDYSTLERPASYPHWENYLEYYGCEKEKRYLNPKRKVQQTLSLSLLLWFVWSVIICTALVLGGAAYFKQSSMSYSHAAGGVSPVPSPYPVCSMRFRSLTITDMAFLCELAYLDDLGNAGAYIDRLATQGYTWLMGNAGEEDWGAGTIPVNFVAVKKETDAATKSSDVFLILKSNLVAEDLGRDIDLWGDSVLMAAMSAVVPFLNSFSEELTTRWVQGLASPKLSLDGDKGADEYLLPLVAYLKVLRLTPEHANATFTLVGHGTNGGIAVVLSSLLSIPAVAISPPGTAQLKAKFSISDSTRVVTVVPKNDEMTRLDKPLGAVQYIDCQASTSGACHDITETTRHLSLVCGEGLFPLQSFTPDPAAGSTQAPTGAPETPAPTPSP